LAEGPNIKGNVWIHEAAKVDPTAVLGPNVMVGEGTFVGPGAKIRETVILDNTCIEGYCLISGSLIGWNNIIKKWSRLEPTTITGAGVEIGEETYLNGITICPNKVVTGNHPIEKIIL
jgi:mannose-1-phosphate guanylyltransferase